MSQIISFPMKHAAAQGGPSAPEIANATAVSGFLVSALARLEAVAGPIQQELLDMSHDQVDLTYEQLSDMVFSGQSSPEDSMLYELVTDEVARRCAIRGLPMPWDDEGPSPVGAA